MKKWNILLLFLVLSIFTVACSTAEETPPTQASPEQETTESKDVKNESDKTKKEAYVLTPEVAQAVTDGFVPLDEIVIPKKKIVALGEATHGNAEFALLKQEVLEYLATEHGCRAFAAEGDFAGATIANQYVLTGVGTPEDAAIAIGYNVFKTKEMAETLEWIQDFNSGREDSDKIRFYGFDPQNFNINKKILLDYLDIVDEAKTEEYRELLTTLDDDLGFDVDKQTLVEGLSGIQKIKSEFQENQENYISKSSKQEYDLIAMHIDNIEQYTILRTRLKPYYDTRNEYMADQIQWISEFEKEFFHNDVIFVAGHVAHVEKESRTQAANVDTGEHLANRFGNEYYVIGTEFIKGTFIAADLDTIPRERNPFTIENPTEKRLLEQFDESILEVGFLDFSTVPAAKEYFDSPQFMTYIGDGFAKEMEEDSNYFGLPMVPSKSYDAVIIFREVHPYTVLDQIS